MRSAADSAGVLRVARHLPGNADLGSRVGAWCVGHLRALGARVRGAQVHRWGLSGVSRRSGIARGLRSRRPTCTTSASIEASLRTRKTSARSDNVQVRAFVQGLLTNLLNPKVAVFYLTFLPQFVAADRPVLTQSVFLAATHVVMGLIWLTIYARFIDRMAAVLLTERVKRRIEAVTGAVLMTLGIRLALARR